MICETLVLKYFNLMVFQEMGFFDEPQNSTGSLTTRLAVDAAAIQGVKNTHVYFEPNMIIFRHIVHVIYFISHLYHYAFLVYYVHS